METYYGQDRKNYHTFRLSDEEEVIFRKLMDKYGYTSISSFIRDAILDEKLTVEICLDPVKYDYSHSIRQLITAIPTLIHRHAYRVRRIVVELVNKLEYLIKLLGESHEKKSDL